MAFLGRHIEVSGTFHRRDRHYITLRNVRLAARVLTEFKPRIIDSGNADSCKMGTAQRVIRAERQSFFSHR